MAEHGRNWSDAEIRALAIWTDETIQRQLQRTTRNAIMFRTISEKLQERGYLRNKKQCREKIKALKRYKEVADRLCHSGMGIESNDDLDNHEIYVDSSGSPIFTL